MTKYIPDKILTQNAYNAMKEQLDPTELVVISDAISPSAPLAVGSVQLRSDTGGDAPGTATYLTTTDETLALPNSTNLGLLGTADAQNLLVNTPTGGEAVLTAVELVADSILNVNTAGELVSTAITADSILTGDSSGALDAWVPGASQVLTTAADGSVSSTTLVADSILNVDPTGVLVSTAITANSFLTGNDDAELAAFAPGNTKLVHTASDGTLASTTMANDSLLVTNATGEPTFPTLTGNSFLTAQGTPAAFSEFIPGNDRVITTSDTGVPSSVAFSANTILYSDNTNTLTASATPSFAGSFSLGTTGVGNVLSFSSEDECNIDAASGTLTSPDYTFTTESGSTLTVIDATGITITPILSEAFTVDTTAGSTFKYLGAASGTGTALVLNASNEIVLDTSSERFKENIREARDINSSRIYDLNLKLYNYKKLDGVASEHSEKDQLGYIAEEVHKLIPEMVNLDKEGNPFSLRTDVLLFILIEEVKKLKKLLDDQVKP